MRKKYTLRFRAVNKDIFDDIKSGKKAVETRAASTKYKNIKAGDSLILVCGTQKFEKKIRKATIFKSITAMLKKYRVKQIMPNLSTQKELESAYYSYSGYREKIKKSGLIAFEL